MNPEHSFRRRAQMEFIPADAAAFKSVAKANKWKLVGPKHKRPPRRAEVESRAHYIHELHGDH